MQCGPCTCMHSICICMKRDPEMCQSRGRGSLCTPSGSAGLVETHGFAQPTSKVYFLHFGPLDERVTLKPKGHFCLQRSSSTQKQRNVEIKLPVRKNKNKKRDQVLTISIFRSALSAGFLIKLQTQIIPNYVNERSVKIHS